MERPIFTHSKFLNAVSANYKAIVRAFSIVLTLTLIFSAVQAQDCNTTMACNDGVQISLDEDCNLVIEPNMILETPPYANSFYDVEAKLANGTAFPQFTVGFDGLGRPIRRVAINRSHIGMKIEVRVSLRGCGNSCWGYASIEDKLPPVITSCPCEERITSFKGQVPGNSLTFINGSTSTCTAGVGFARDYTVFQFSVDSTGIVDVNLSQAALKFNLYSGSFDRLNPCTNLVSGAYYRNSFSGSLTKNVNYFLVVYTGSDNPTWYNEAVDGLTLDSRVGNIKSSAIASICKLTCSSEAAFLSQTATNATNRPEFSDACSGAMWTPTTSGQGTVNYSGSTFTLTGGNNPANANIVTVGAQLCYTSPIAQTITFDWATSIVNGSLDPVTYTVNGAATVIASTSSSGSTSVALPLGSTFCFRVQTNNVDAFSSLTVSYITVSGVSPTLTYFKNDTIRVLNCTYRFDKIIRRDWTATDPSGNVSPVKSQYFYVERADTSTIACPADWIRSCTTYTFGANDRLPNGAPKPSVSGQPTSTGCSNIQIYYDDVVIPLCGVGFKVLRKWHILDWCTGDEKECNQLIKYHDDAKPVVTCPADITAQQGNATIIPADVIIANSLTCTGTWAVKPPIAVFDCSKITWEVFFKKADINGNPPANTPFTKVDGNTSVTGTKPAFAATISQTDRPYTISGLPLGRTWLKYVITDECGNFTECFTEIDVVDRTPPTAICEDETVIALDDDGIAELKAFSLDNHSTDNCGPIAKYEIRRKSTNCPNYASDLTFGPLVRFCCEDVTSSVTYIDVVLRVYDAAGNYNECETKVRVKNNNPPSITCPANVTLTCGNAKIGPWVAGNVAFDTTLFGKPTLGGRCFNLQFASRIIANNLNAKCGTGTVDREWYLISNPSIKCTQRLTVVSPTFSSADVNWPANVTIPSCDVSKATPDVLNSKPTVNTLSCRDIGISYVDQPFTNVPETCIKILRTWRIIDWCSYPASQVVAEYTQVIKLTGSGGAQFTGCGNKTFDADAGSCDKEVTLTVNASDECTDPNDLKYSWSLDIDKNGTIDQTGVTKSITKILHAGTHRITFTVVNKCGTPATCAYDVIIRATKKPTPICLREVVWVLGSTGSTEVWASDFNLKSESNCGNTNRLKYAFDERGTQLARTFTCADIPNGQVARIPLKMYVIDENGSFDFCDVVLVLQDSPLTNACRDVPSLLPVIGGRITTDKNEGVDNIEVSMKNMVTSSEFKAVTKDQGVYRFTGIDVFDPKSVGAYKNSDVLNGVSTLDLVLIQRHILGIQTLDSPYKLLAADINNSKNITAGDLISLRKLVLGVTDKFDNNTSWRFIPKEYKFSDSANPFDYQEKINLDSIFEDKSNIDFIAIKTGDVNSSALANVNSIPTEKRSNPTLFTASKSDFESGKLVKFEVKAGEDMHIIGTQFGLEFNPDQLAFSGVKAGAFDMKSHHYNAMHVANGKISFSYDIPSGVELDVDQVLFTVEFRSLGKGNTSDIKIAQNGLAAEVYEADATVKPLDLHVKNSSGTALRNVLYQNEPNPFKDYTTISFELAKTSEVILRVVDVTGKLVMSQSGQFQKGYNTISISNTQLNKSGVYYYKIDTGDFSATKKMILIE
jgi:hypothetical protein